MSALIRGRRPWMYLSIAVVLGFAGALAAVACQAAANDFATDGNSPHTTYTDVDVAAGIVPGITNGRIVANDPSIGTAAADIWDGVGDLVWPETADTITLVSTNSLDTSAGDGARTVIVTGLDVNFETLVEIVSMSGLTPVSTSGEFIRVNQLFVASVGLYGGSNLGLITAIHDGNSSDQAFVQIGKGVSQKSHFTIPAGHYVVFRNVTIGTDSTKVATFEFLVRANATIPPVAPFAAIVEPVTLAGIAAATEMRILNGRAVTEKSDVWVQGSANSPGGFVSLGIDFLLFETANLVGITASGQCEVGC